MTPAAGTVYLVCTSAGEVGVNISADHLVCDLSTFESMAQRFGRVNRFGDRADTRIDVVHSTKFDDTDTDLRRQKTLTLLRDLGGDGSPAALGRLDPVARVAAFAPTPTILPVSDILFDTWALTTIRDRLPGRPKVEPYLHGIADWQPPETLVAWREEVEKLHPLDATDEDRKALGKLAESLLDDFPLKPHELLREPSHRAFKHFEAIAKRGPDRPVWLLDDGKVEVLTLAELADKDTKERIEGVTVILPPSAGGLDRGMLNGPAAAPEGPSLDVAEECFTPVGARQRLRTMDPKDQRARGMRLVRRVPLPGGADDENPVFWYWFASGNEGDPSARKPVEWCVHVADVEREAANIVAGLRLPEVIREAVRLAAKYHDHGKRRKLFQTVLGNTKFPAVVLAKSGANGGRIAETYRHEFGSLLDVRAEAEYQKLDADLQDLVLHLIATHHGRGRPHFPRDEVFDPWAGEAAAAAVAREVPRRFDRLLLC